MGKIYIIRNIWACFKAEDTTIENLVLKNAYSTKEKAIKALEKCISELIVGEEDKYEIYKKDDNIIIYHLNDRNCVDKFYIEELTLI